MAAPIAEGGTEAGSLAPLEGEELQDTIFELQLEDEGAGESPPGSPPAGGEPGIQIPGAQPAPATETPPVEQRLREFEERTLAAERRANEAMAVVMPWLRDMQGRMQGQQQPQIPTREFLQSDQASTPDLLNYIDGNLSNIQQQSLNLMRMEAQRAASESHARGMLNHQALPEGWAFDQIRSKYCQPFYERNPAMRDIAAAIGSENPALTEYWLGVLLMVDEMSKGDPLKVAQTFANALSGTAQRQTLQQVQTAARSAAGRVAAASATGRQGEGPKRTVGAEEIKLMSDQDFDRLDQQLTGGL